MPKLPSVNIVVLNWNGLKDTIECLQSLRRIDYPAFRIVVVDNGSTDGSETCIRDQFPEHTLITNSENLGFTGGNNIGIRKSLQDGADYILLLNNDTEVAPDFLRILVETSETDPRIGVIGPIIFYHEQPQTVWSAGGNLDWRGRAQMIGINEVDSGQFTGSYHDVDFVSGCAMLMKKAVLERVGMLDERFFAYFEETEWCVRARRSGFRIVNAHHAKIWHKIPLDARESSPIVHYYMTRNRLLLLKSVGAGPLAFVYTLFAEYLRTLLSWSLRPKWRGKKRHRKMMFQAIVDAGLGRWGRYSTNKAS